MSQAVLNNNITDTEPCEGRESDIFISFLDYYTFGTLNLLYSGFDATTTDHIWQQGSLAGNTWTDVQTGGVTLNNDKLPKLPPEENFYLIRVVYTDKCGFNHYTEVNVFITVA